MPSIRVTFAKNLIKHRRKCMLTQEQLAEKLEISVRYIQLLEGKRTPNVKIDTIEKIAKALDIKPKELF